MLNNLYTLENRFLRLDLLADSPRIVRLCAFGGQNLFAELGEQAVSTAFGEFFFRGGHRLWHAPEAMPRTYLPDAGATLSKIPGGARLDAPAEPWTHIAKSLEVRLNPNAAQVFLRHELRNEGPWAVELAPWALTMFRLGGVAVFPQAQGNVDAAGLLPNRQLTLWPYTHLNDPRLILRDDFILLRADPEGKSAIKLGYFNPSGWQAYFIENTLFVKRFNPLPGANFPDGGCNTESYCNHQFLELESLGALTRLEPGASIEHLETWEIYSGLEPALLPDEISRLMANLP
ncbi:MAG: hypothetical protein CO094_00865 [Anaerolineae bacterium CG_4_9_14_3_um_filter_57_17]|nr:hypothetical protein [bacterium]NCT21228.1 hypothetical protein [bacterium]OIO84256.1 MAG: hypothetical protein AUK01_10160 [Anaerolineae bacterium CG2_30_57_67]PJB68604.1 MAG: hypothetical protein CO094_00865 [Anaerolineae bacterium CG_4_9_14_3_um_filter_57_17]